MTADNTLSKFLEYSDRLAANAEADDNVIGLIFLGSAADHSRVDEWSDHDFFLMVKAGFGEQYRGDLSWIPDIEQAVLHPRETDHGLKVVFGDGRVLEFAVFEDAELELASVNSWAAVVDKTDLTPRLEKIEARSSASAAKPFDRAKEFELFLALILIGTGRHRRGETLIAGQFIRSYALRNLLGLIRDAHAPVPGTEAKQDNLDRYRRFELQYPSLGRRIENALQKDLDAAALALVEIAEGLRPLSDREAAQVAAVRGRLGWV